MSDNEWEAVSVDDEEQAKFEAPNLLIAIDTDEAMFQVDADNRSTFQKVLASCYEILDGMLLKMGKESKNKLAVAVVSDDKEKVSISDFGNPLPDSIKKLRGLCNRSNDELRDLYMRPAALNVADFFIHCKKIFTQCNLDSFKYLIYITKTDNPVMDDEDKKFHAVNQATTFQPFNIYLQLLTFNPTFDYSVFFEEILSAAKCKFNYEYFVDTIGMKEKILSLIIYKGTKTRFYPFRSKLKFFEVIEKRYVKPPRLLNNVVVTKGDNKEVKIIKRGQTDTGSYKLSYSKDKDPMKFTLSEVQAMAEDGVPVGFSLLSTSKSLVKPGILNSDPKFVQNNCKPNEPYFDLFWQYCVDRDRVLLCARKYRKGDHAKLMELSPKLINNVRSFLVIGIPFQGAVEKFEAMMDEKVGAPCTRRQLTAAEDLVNALTFQYHPSTFSDGVYCRKRNYVRSELLEEPPEEADDVGKKRVVMGDVTQVIEAFKRVCFDEPVAGAKKRKNATKSTQPRKRGGVIVID